MPDGEVGPRRHWISRIHYQVLSGHPELEAVRRPQPENGVERLFPRNAADSWLFKVKDGVKQVRFGDPGWRLGYARDAINSYFVFKTLRGQGVLAKHLRFQVSLHRSIAPCRRGSFRTPPMSPGSGLASPTRWRRSSARLSANSERRSGDPMGLCDRGAGCLRRGSWLFRRRRHRAQRRAVPQALAAHSREGAAWLSLLFRHAGRLAAFAPADLSATVALANAVVELSGRRVDWIHIPVLDNVGDAFFAPLKELRPRGARVYLGVIHHMDGFKDRVAAARKYLPDFGVAAYCGFGRIPPSDMPAVLQEHQQAINAAGPGFIGI